MDKFRAGQKVRVINVVQPENKHLIGNIYTYKCKLSFGCHVEEPINSYRGFTFLENHLEPVYDGDEKSSWSESVWKPKELIKE